MKDIEQLISPLIQNQFPDFYREEGPRFIDFVKQYYVWMEQQNQAIGASRSLFSTRDIDKTADEFLIHFKQKYFPGVPFAGAGDTRMLTKHALDLYHVKGTQRGVEFIIQGLFNEEATVYYPGDDIFKTSHGTWVKPTYLELSVAERTKQFVGKEIIGNTSGAKAFLEGLVRRRIGSKFVEVAYLSNLRGDFVTGEYITESFNTVLEGAPLVRGSMTTLTVTVGGADNQVGDIFDVVSSNGKQGKARVTSVSNETGKVNFLFANSFVDGGWGFTTNAQVLISSKVLVTENKTNANTQITDFQKFELVKQYLANVAYDTASPDNTGFTVGDVIENYYANGMVCANAVIVSAGTSSSTTGYLVVSPRYGNVASFDTTFSKKGNTTTAVITGYYDRTVTGNVVGTNTTAVGVHSITGGAFVITPHANLVGYVSGTTATIANVSTGTGANFEIGYITDTESVYLTPDFLGSNNTQDIKYIGYQTTRAYFNANTGVNGTTDVITTTAAHGFSNGEYVRYDVSTGNTAIIGLLDGGLYYISNTTSTTFKLSQTNGGTALNLTAGIVSETGHRLSSIYGGTVLTSINLNGNNSGAALQYGTSQALSDGSTAYGGFGFPKFPGSNMDSILLDCLRFEQTTIGSIASLTAFNPGNDYNFDPFVEVYEPSVAAYNHRDIVLGITSVDGAFTVGEQIQQSYSNPGVQLTFGGFVGTTANGMSSTAPVQTERVYQKYANGSVRAYGFVVEGGSTTVKLANVSGTFVLTSNNSTKMFTQTSNATANISATGAITIATSARGFVKDGSNSTVLFIKRINLENTFKGGETIIGRTSGANAVLSTVDIDPATERIGINANVTANVQTANGVATTLDVQDSGFGYIERETVTLSSANSNFVLTAVVSLGKQGVGEGFFSTTRGFLDSDKRLQDNNYYQEYSYEVQTKVPFDLYFDILKQVTHVAGTKAFGSVQALSIANTEMTVINSIEIS